MIFAYDKDGIVATNRVPVGRSVNAQYYKDFLRQNLRPKIRKLRPGMLERGVLILHDNARPHIADVVSDYLDKTDWETLPYPAYSPDMSPPDFDLFPKLKEPLRGIRFPTLNDLSSAVTRRIRQLHVPGALTGIADLPKRWQACIEKQGDYIEGL